MSEGNDEVREWRPEELNAWADRMANESMKNMRSHCRRKCPKQVGRMEEGCICGFSDGGKQWANGKGACGWGVVWSNGKEVYELEEGGVFMGVQGNSFTAEVVGLGHLVERMEW